MKFKDIKYKMDCDFYITYTDDFGKEYYFEFNKLMLFVENGNIYGAHFIEFDDWEVKRFYLEDTTHSSLLFIELKMHD